MKKLLFIIVALVAQITMAQSSPFQPEVDKRFKLLEATSVGGTLSDGYIIVGNSAAKASQVVMSGGATMDDTGVVTISTAAGSVPTSSLADYTANGLHPIRVARGTYTWATAVSAVGAHAFNVSLPAKSIITKAWYFIATQFSNTSGTTQASFECEDGANIMALRTITGFASGTIQGADVSGPSANMVGNINAACGLVMTISKTNAGAADSSLNAGRLILFVEYVVGI